MALAVLVGLSGCAGAGDSSPTPTIEESDMPNSSPSAHVFGSIKPTAPARIGDTITGTLGFDDVESGCAYLEVDDGTRYQVMYPEGWKLNRSPLQLVSPDGDVVARTGDEISVRGQTVPDMASTCQIGPIFRAAEVLAP